MRPAPVRIGLPDNTACVPLADAWYINSTPVNRKKTDLQRTNNNGKLLL